MFNVNSNWLTDLCQPGIPRLNRFSNDVVPVSVPRNTVEQTRDCPPAVLPPFEHLGAHRCPYTPRCEHSNAMQSASEIFDAGALPVVYPERSSQPLKSTSKTRSYRDAVLNRPSLKSDAGSTTPRPPNPLVNCQAKFCLPRLDYEGLCHCTVQDLTPHVPVLPYTPGSILAKKLRENEDKIAKITNSRVKIVERTGVSLEIFSISEKIGIECLDQSFACRHLAQV